MTITKFESNTEVIAFVTANTPFFKETAPTVVEEIGDGNINFVYRVSNKVHSVIVKQALPYVRIIGEGWPLSLDRIRIEAACLQEEGRWAADYVPKVFYFDPELSAVIMEDIGDHENLRHALIARQPLPLLGEQLGQFLAETLFHTSDFYLDNYEKKAAVANYINPDLCKITEELFFWDPYCDHERNSINPALKEAAQHLWEDQALKAEVAKLKYHFMNDAQALLHGDLHAGSVFVKADSTKVIDPEFAFYGPMAFDIGSIIGNLLLNYTAQFGLPGEQNDKLLYREQLLNTIETLWHTFSKGFIKRASDKCIDPVFSATGFVEAFLKQIWLESMGYAGTELIRRVVGLAHVADLETISDADVRAHSEKLALELGVLLIKQRHEIRSASVLRAIVQSIS